MELDITRTWGRLQHQAEQLGHPGHRGLDDLEMATVEYINWYNNRRLHGELGHVPPAFLVVTRATESVKGVPAQATES